MKLKRELAFSVNIFRSMLFIVAVTWAGNSIAQRPTGTRNLDIPAEQNVGPQVDSIVKKELIFAFYELNDLSTILTIYDTSLNNVHRIEPYYQTHLNYGNLGSENSASYNLIWSKAPDIGIFTGQDSYEIGYGNKNANRLFDLNRPYWSFHFGQGFNIGATNIDARFYKRFARNILLNFNYRLLTDASPSGGLATEFKNMDLKLSQFSEKNARRTVVGYKSYRISDEFSLTGAEVFGSATEGLQSRSEYYALNEIDFSDTTKSTIRRLTSQLSFKSNTYNFMDDQISADERVYYQLVDSFDLVNYLNDLSEIGFLNRFDVKSKTQGYYGKVDFSLFNHNLSGFDEKLQEITIGLGTSRQMAKMKLNLDAEFGLIDASGAYLVSSDLTVPMGTQELKTSVSISSNVPALLFRRVQFNDNLFSVNELENLKSYRLGFEYVMPKIDFKLGLRYTLSQNELILMPSLDVFQSSASIDAIDLYAFKAFKFGILTNQLSANYQSISSELIQRPRFFANNDLFLDFKFFKKRMDTRIGADLKFVKSFIVPAYSHVLGITAYDDRQQASGNLFLINPYASIKVEKFYAFIKVNNALSRLQSNSQYWINGFPMYDFRFVFGIRWDLLD